MMFYDPDKFDLYITILKFLAVVSSGMLAGEAMYVSTTHLPSLLAISNVDKSLRNFRYFWPRGFQMYRTTLVGSLAACGVFVFEVRDRFSWLYGALGLLSIFLYTKFYVFPNVINYLTDLDLSAKDERHIHDMLVRFQRDHYFRTLMSAISFTWLTYSLYMS